MVRMIRCCSLRPGVELVPGQLLDAVGQGGELVRQRSRVGLVGEQEVEDRGRLEMIHVASTVRHGAVGDQQEGLQERSLGPARVDQEAEQVDDLEGPFQPPAHVEEAPALAPGHALGDEPAEGRQAR